MAGRSDSTHIQAELMARAARGEDVPKGAKLRKCDLPYWAAIVRARAEWTDVDLYHAVNLSSTLADIERIRKEIKKEGDTLKNDRGTVTMNPKHSLLEVLSRRSVALSRMLQVHAQATVGRSGDQPTKSRAKNKAIAATVAVENDALFAKPDVSH